MTKTHQTRNTSRAMAKTTPATSVNGSGSWLGLHNGDARDILQMVPENSVDLILTSPPYADLKDYGYRGQIGFGQGFEEYLQDVRAVLEACFRVAKPTATLWLVSDGFKKNGEMIDLPAELGRCASKVGWRLQDVIIWHKTKTLPWSHRGRLRKIFEHIYVFAKSKGYKYYSERIRDTEDLQEWWAKYPERYSPSGKTPHNIWYFPIPTQGSWGNGVLRHFNPFPPTLVERIVDLTTDPGDVVMDPFAGTGTVLAQAECMERKAVGIEMNPDFANKLFPRVRGEIQRTWSNRSQRGKERQARAEEFDSLILRMRKVKLAKQIVKILALPREADECAVHLLMGLLIDKPLALSLPRHKLGAVELLLVGDSPACSIISVERALAACSRPPLSKFGVRIEVRAIAIQQLFTEPWSQRLSEKDPWFVYPATALHVHGGRVESPEILNFCRGLGGTHWVRRHLPPIFSDICVDRKELSGFLN